MSDDPLLPLPAMPVLISQLVRSVDEFKSESTPATDLYNNTALRSVALCGIVVGVTGDGHIWIDDGSGECIKLSIPSTIHQAPQSPEQLVGLTLYTLKACLSQAYNGLLRCGVSMSVPLNHLYRSFGGCMLSIYTSISIGILIVSCFVFVK